MASNIFNLRGGVGEMSAPQGVDGRYLYVSDVKIKGSQETTAGEFELLVGDYPPIILRRYDELDLLEFAQQDRIIRLRNLLGESLDITIYSSAIPFSKKRETILSAESVIGLVDGTIVGIDSNQNAVQVVNEVAQASAQHAAILNSLGELKEQNKALAKILEQLPDAIKNLQNNSAPARVSGKIYEITATQTFANFLACSIFSTDDKSYKIDDVEISADVLTELPPLSGAVYESIKIEAQAGGKLMCQIIQ